MRIAALIAILLLGLSSLSYAETLTFRNFEREVQLIPQQDHFIVAGTGQAVRLANRLIVQASPALSRVELTQKHKAIARVTSLFTSKDSQYFAVELAADEKLTDVLKILSSQNDILLVQPDLLQLAQRTHAVTSNSSMPVADFLPSQQRDHLWQRSRGKGVKIAIIDDGFDLTHPALINAHVAFSYDTETHALTAAPLSPRDSHGTRVAGVLFAAAQSDRIQGLAPEAELIAIRQPDSWTSNTLLAFHLAVLAGADVINCSWTTPLLLQPVADAVQVLAREGRQGKGVAVVFAAGNEGRAIEYRDSEAAIPDAIVVAATDAQGQRLNNSNFGTSVDLSAFGGSVDSTAVTGGYAPFGGTSLASAIVSGMAALLIGADPSQDLPRLLQQLQALSIPKATPVASTPSKDDLNAGL